MSRGMKKCLAMMIKLGIRENKMNKIYLFTVPSSMIMFCFIKDALKYIDPVLFYTWEEYFIFDVIVAIIAALPIGYLANEIENRGKNNE